MRIWGDCWRNSIVRGWRKTRSWCSPSDHGTTFGSHRIDQIYHPFEEATRDPLIVRYPRKVKRRVEAQALFSNVDSAPTLLSLCDVRLPPGMQGLDQSALLLRGRGPRTSSVNAQGALGSPTEWRMVVRGGEKVVVDYSLNPTHFFDLKNDPYELENLVALPAARRTRDGMVQLLRA